MIAALEGHLFEYLPEETEKYVKIKLNLPLQDFLALKQLAEKRNIDIKIIFENALILYSLLAKDAKNGKIDYVSLNNKKTEIYLK